MTNLLTKGGLVPATLKNLETNDIVKFMFNPYEYTISKSATYEVTDVLGQNMGETSFKSGSPISISLTLYFDTTDTRRMGSLTGPQGSETGRSTTVTSVRNYTKYLWSMIYVSEQARDADDHKSKPPKVEFQWGEVRFEGVVTKLAEKLTLFAEDGTPLRAEVSVDLQQHDDDTVTLPQSRPEWSNTNLPKISTFNAGTRLDLINMVSGTSSGMREIAANNGIDDPLNIPNGMDLIL